MAKMKLLSLIHILHGQELRSEQMRLLYVALTRCV